MQARHVAINSAPSPSAGTSCQHHLQQHLHTQQQHCHRLPCSRGAAHAQPSLAQAHTSLPPPPTSPLLPKSRASLLHSDCEPCHIKRRGRRRRSLAAAGTRASPSEVSLPHQKGVQHDRDTPQQTPTAGPSQGSSTAHEPGSATHSAPGSGDVRPDVLPVMTIVTETLASQVRESLWTSANMECAQYFMHLNPLRGR